MREVRLVVIYFVGVVVLAALLAPPLFWLGQWAGATWSVRVLTSSGFERYFNRAILIAAVVLIFPLVRTLRIRSAEAAGLQVGPRPWRMLVIGLASSLIIMVMEWIIIQSTAWFPAGSGGAMAALPRILMTAVVVSVLEETLFRGVLQKIMMRGLGTAGLVLTALVFAAIHYVKPPAYAVTGPDVGWGSGFALLPHAFWLFDLIPAATFAALGALILAGLILGRAALMSGGLALPFGIHAGWILGLEFMKKLLDRSEAVWPWIGQDLLGGVVPGLLLICQGVALECWYRRLKAK